MKYRTWLDKNEWIHLDPNPELDQCENKIMFKGNKEMRDVILALILIVLVATYGKAKEDNFKLRRLLDARIKVTKCY